MQVNHPRLKPWVVHGKIDILFMKLLPIDNMFVFENSFMLISFLHYVEPVLRKTLKPTVMRI